MIKCDARSISNRLPGTSMTSLHVDSQLVFAWQAAHSIARGSPAPVHDRGGIRVDTRSETETTRWVFPRMCDGLREIAQAITAPRHVLKLCGTDDALRSALPDRWEIQPTNHFMIATAALLDPRPLADGYRLELHRAGPVSRASVLAPDGGIAAHGTAAQTGDAFIYDRIETLPDHRRRGLGMAVMAALASTKESATTPQLLVATADGRALYETLGWTVLTPIAAAVIPER